MCKARQNWNKKKYDKMRAFVRKTKCELKAVQKENAALKTKVVDFDVEEVQSKELTKKQSKEMKN